MKLGIDTSVTYMITKKLKEIGFEEKKYFFFKGRTLPIFFKFWGPTAHCLYFNYSVLQYAEACSMHSSVSNSWDSFTKTSNSVRESN